MMWDFAALIGHVIYLFCVFQVRAEITSKEKEEEDMMEKVQKETKYETPSNTYNIVV